MGKWIHRTREQLRSYHGECRLPQSWFSGEPRGGFGSLWECGCGKRWEIIHDKGKYYPGKSWKPVKSWREVDKK